MLARKALEFDKAIRILEATEKRTHPLRLELHNFFFVQAIAGPERSRVMSVFLHGMSWLTLVALPVVVLLYVQVVFLPYHDTGITWAHRAAVTADVALLGLIGVFLTRPEVSIFSAVGRITVKHPLALAATMSVLLFVLVFSYLVATIPGEPLDRVARGLSRPAGIAVQPERVTYGFAVPFLGPRSDGTLFGVFEKNLNVTDLDLVADKDVTAGEPSRNLRGRDLRFARLDRTDLHQADLTGANLEGASLVGADLRNIILQCADVDELILTGDRAKAQCPHAPRANFSGAKLSGARLLGADLRGARFEGADLAGADLTYAALSGASFYNAHLERADLTGGIALQGANFATAVLRGADLTGAKLQGADFTSASLKGAMLAHTQLHGARLRDADLEAADLYKAQLFGADLRGAKVRAASLVEARVWMTMPPDRDRDSVLLLDASDLAIAPPNATEIAGLRDAIEKVEPASQRDRVRAALAPLLAAQPSRGWSGSEPQIWSELVAGASGAALGDGFKARLTDYLVRLACRSTWADGSLATGLARRAQGIEFKGEPVQVYDRLRAEDCPASKTISPRALRKLADRVE
jgi:uncharacterized protein YjbI with pentapeptide repeats